MLILINKVKQISKYGAVALLAGMLSATTNAQTTNNCTDVDGNPVTTTQPSKLPTGLLPDAATVRSTLGAAGTAAYDNCGNGVLDPGECCDLGTAMNGIDAIGGGASGASPDGKTDHGCHANCTIDKQGDWDCNKPDEGFDGYAKWVGYMNSLYTAVVAFAEANNTAGLKCNNAPGNGGRDDSAADSYDQGDEQTGPVNITSCVDYEEALARFNGYNSSHPIDGSVYQAGKNLFYQGNGKNYNTCLEVGTTVPAGTSGVNVSACP